MIRPLLLAGLPGRMAAEVALAASEADSDSRFRLLPHALSSDARHGQSHRVGSTDFHLVGPARRDGLAIPPGTIAVDFTEPGVALANIEFYCARGIPFVLGTTGFDLARAQSIVKSSGVSAVIAPNMAIPIVLIQLATDYLARNFAGALAGHSLRIRESHQSTKKDTSGTARALVRDFAALGLPASLDAIEMVRDPQVQQEDLHVPAEYLRGHAYHFYDVESAGGDVRLGLSHCIHGRRVYANGSLRAVEFLAKRLAAGSKGEVFTMKDVVAGMG